MNEIEQSFGDIYDPDASLLSQKVYDTPRIVIFCRSVDTAGLVYPELPRFLSKLRHVQTERCQKKSRLRYAPLRNEAVLLVRIDVTGSISQ